MAPRRAVLAASSSTFAHKVRGPAVPTYAPTPFRLSHVECSLGDQQLKAYLQVERLPIKVRIGVNLYDQFAAVRFVVSTAAS
jgi:hypothetical protein